VWRSEEGDLLVSTLHRPLATNLRRASGPGLYDSPDRGGMWVESGASESAQWGRQHRLIPGAIFVIHELGRLSK
jgi:hypothetical protein